MINYYRLIGFLFFVLLSNCLKINKCNFEEKILLLGFDRIAGVDEVGRGSLAGPVVSAAVILPINFNLFSSDIGDSKNLSPKKREYLYDLIYNFALGIGIGIVDAFEIDRINILNASLLSMCIAVKNLFPPPDYLLIDGIFELPMNISQTAIKKGDSLSFSIGAASIIAKVTRDRLMCYANSIFPEFGFDRHKGYATEMHRKNINRYGHCYLHRKTFKGVKK